jgi:molybdenum cofactor cytidylyltransferase
LRGSSEKDLNDQQAYMTEVAAIILAAGSSSRMGRPKQLLRLGETTLLAETVCNVQQVALSEVLLVLGHDAEKIERSLPVELLSSMKVVVNYQYEEGIATSLRKGIAALAPSTDAALIILADQPFVQPATLTRLISDYRCGGASIIIPTFQGQRGNPVLLGKSILSEALRLQHDAGFRSLFPSHLQDIRCVEVEDAGVLLDIDTPAEYEKFTSKP